MKSSKLDRWIQETEGISGLDREKLEALQLQRLNRLLGIRRLPALSSLRELSSLPFTTAGELAAHPGRFLAVSQSEVCRVISGATSGTTGEAKRVFYTHADLDHTVGFFAAGIAEMLRPGEKCLIAFPFSGTFGLGDLISKAVESLGGIPIAAGYGSSWGQMAALVRQEKPECYIGFPAALLGLVRFMGPDCSIHRGLISADACPEGIQHALEDLGIRLYPHYGSRECGLGGAVTCPAHAGMHLRENHLIAEIVDEAGTVLPLGAYGELVLTTIGLEAMPLIRYRTGDYTRFLPDCPCGSVTRRIAPVTRAGGARMEALDSRLFACPSLVDCRIFDGMRMEALLTDLSWMSDLQRRLPPGAVLSARACTSADVPMYPGKRHVLKDGFS